MVQKKGNPNVRVFVKNVECDLNNHKNNDSKPFYIVSESCMQQS